MNNLQHRATAAGIQITNEIMGEHRNVTDATLQILLDGLGAPPDSGAYMPVQILDEQRTYHLPAFNATAWKLRNERGETQTGTPIHDEVQLPPLVAGYYQLALTTASQSLNTTLIVAPQKCWQPDQIANGKRIWGIATQLYSLRSHSNWGMGDYGDLVALVEQANQLGADVIGINPVSAMFPNNPTHLSPYSPSDRLSLNTVYIDVNSVDGFADCTEAQALWTNADFQNKLSAARDAATVDYVTINDLKQQVLQTLFQHFETQANHDKFDTFCAAHGKRLQHKAVFDALGRHFNEKESRVTNWHEWPAAFHNHALQEVAAFAKAHNSEIRYYCWLQWLADKQLARAQNIALQRGMTLGLYRDLAVGCDGAGAELWLNQDAFIADVAIGSPPDAYNPAGQNWGLPPFNPHYLRQQAYAPFINLLRANMRHARTLRIDHAFALSRLYLIPHGMGSADGAYLNYPVEELMAVLRLESHRNQCMVIGEDLGLFPENYKENATASGLFSYKVFFFERDKNNDFLPPSYYPQQALSVFSTHDLPTLAGWWSNTDINEKTLLKIYPDKNLENQDRTARPLDKQRLLDALAKQSLPTNDLITGVHAYLARSASSIIMLQLEDVLGMPEQMNIPSTVDERANWRMKLTAPLEDIFADGNKLHVLSKILNIERARPLIDYPRATYRLQFHKDFTFYDAANIMPYLAQLGISHIYASSYMTARPGSTHGYDVIDHNQLNPEMGGAEGYAIYLQALRDNNLKQILDFVPNHMGVGVDNNWWLNVLEWGQQSPFAKYFDISWQARQGKIILPSLGQHYGDALAAGELKLVFDKMHGSFNLHYFDNFFPVCPVDYHTICADISEIENNVKAGEDLKNALMTNSSLYEAIARAVSVINNDRVRLHALLERQHYQLAFWRVASSDINYRRFFDINELAALRVEDDEIFDKIHGFVFDEIANGNLQGLRIDHIDGLADPARYCRRLREKTGSSAYLTVEKILGVHETTRRGWPIDGTSGYDALNDIGAVFVNPRAEQHLDKTYRDFTGIRRPFDRLVYNAKKLILDSSLTSELLRITRELKMIADSSAYTRDYPQEVLRTALEDVISWFPVYRTYINAHEFDKNDAIVITWAIGRAKKHSQLADISVYDFLASILTVERPCDNIAILGLVKRFQQLSGPVMAKGLEDTTFYRFNRLLSLNEVGGAPSRFGASVTDFHKTIGERIKNIPHSMLTTATHDTKRGEDLRARLSVLSEMPLAWRKHVNTWAKLNRAKRTVFEKTAVPSPNEEYFIYQILLGSWPVELLHRPFETSAHDSYLKRLDEYLLKALREAKLNSSWSLPQEDYEKLVSAFVHAILDISKQNTFLDSFLLFVNKLAAWGAARGLAQVVLKLTLPGVPDVYQGTEFWDLSLVDPDNRRPVDYEMRVMTLVDNTPLAILYQNWRSGAIKQRVMAMLLVHRAQYAELYTYGSYEPLTVSGKYADRVIAYARRWQDQMLITAILVRGDINKTSMQNAFITLPDGFTGKNIMTSQAVNSHSQISLADCFDGMPIAVFASA